MKFEGTWRCKGADEECEGRQSPSLTGKDRAAGCVHPCVCPGAAGNQACLVMLSGDHWCV